MQFSTLGKNATVALLNKGFNAKLLSIFIEKCGNCRLTASTALWTVTSNDSRCISEILSKTTKLTPLTGHIEIDETYVGGVQEGKQTRATRNKTIVVGVSNATAKCAPRSLKT